MKDLMKRRRSDEGAGEREPDTSAPAPAKGGRVATAGRRISPTVSSAAITEAQNAVAAAQTSGDYRFQSVGDLLRAALRAYADGLRLTQQVRSGARKRHTVELPAELLEHYDRLPSRSRGEIIERALLSFLMEGIGSRGHSS